GVRFDACVGRVGGVSWVSLEIPPGENGVCGQHNHETPETAGGFRVFRDFSSPGRGILACFRPSCCRDCTNSKRADTRSRGASSLLRSNRNSPLTTRVPSALPVNAFSRRPCLHPSDEKKPKFP